MAMTSRLRKVALIAHVASSIGWFGAIAAFLVLAVSGLPREDALLMRAAYLTMALTAWFAILPLALVSFISGIISSVGTKWGLIKHYWVLVKFLTTIVITALLLLHMQPIELLAGAAAVTPELGPHLGGLRIQMVVYAIATLLVLIVLTALSVYKPLGLTKHGWRKQYQERAP